jgi:hypothetical protein
MCDRIGTGRPKEQPFRLRKYMAMVDEAMRDPISVGMLKVDGARVMDVTHETPGPRIGWILHALLEEVLDDPTKNTAEYLENRATTLAQLDDDTLKSRGLSGKDRRQTQDEAAIQNLREKHHVW